MNIHVAAYLFVIVDINTAAMSSWASHLAVLITCRCHTEMGRPMCQITRSHLLFLVRENCLPEGIWLRHCMGVAFDEVTSETYDGSIVPC